MQSFNEREFRHALGYFATGIVIITPQADGQQLGASVSSFNSVSLTPPLILFSLARSAYSLAQWRNVRSYGVTFLGEDQVEISNRFARSGANKWEGIDTRYMSNGAPLIPGWLAYFECEQYNRYDGGDHEIFVGRVTRFAYSTKTAKPLIFYRGQYRGLSLDEAAPALPDVNLRLHGYKWRFPDKHDATIELAVLLAEADRRRSSFAAGSSLWFEQKGRRAQPPASGPP
jgi:flavin reductase (DIM6/NTAB) family NADH-FMN oxidoreductase RutF